MKSFFTEQSMYEKTSLSELQGAWENFMTKLINLHPFEDSDRVIFHVNEAMSWEIVRNLHEMKRIYILIRNIITKNLHHDDLAEELDEIRMCLDDALDEYGK